ncbi:MAG: serine/threonine-protein kinase PknK [Polyangiaceae bacterium]
MREGENLAQPDDPNASTADSFLREAAAVSEPTGGEYPPLGLTAGDVLSERFVVERLAGSGGMGAVYRALDRLSGSPVALKVMTARGHHEQRFAQEARVLSDLNHPAIVRYVAHGETVGGQPYLAMEWLEGADLAQRITRARLGVGESLEVAKRVAEGLAVAHGRGVVHRDVKPSNVLLVDGQPARAKLLDFGIVRMELSGSAPTAMPMTRTGAVMGTVGYMSPEQAIGDKNLDARTDVFALGCVLFECLAGEPVFSGDHVVAVLAKVLREEAPRLRSLRPELPEALDALVARMLSKDRGLRPEHGAAVLKELLALGSIAGGAPEAGLRPAAGLSISEQRMTSVILAIAPEEGVSEIVRRHGLDLARLANGALLVTLGARAAASEQVMIAAACALDLLAAHPSARIALATGRALTTAGGPPGPVIDQAAALLVHSISPGIRLDEVTAGLLGERFEVREDAQGRALVGKRGEAESARTLLGKATPFVGRDKELTLLEGTLRECIDESVARAVLVTGPAGQGKSRLRQELTTKARARGDVRVLMARADPVGAGSAFMMVRQLVRHAVGVREGDPVEEQHGKLRAYVAKLGNTEDAGRLADFLGELISAPTSGRPSPELRAARNDPTIMAEWLRRSFAEWIAAECSQGPLLLVLEDLHWGDLPSVTYLGEALRALAAQPLMVLALARPEVHDAFPSLWKGAAEIGLGGLTPRAAERLVRAALADGVTPDTVSRIVKRADGNAFYLEELVRRVSEGGGDALPETVLALVQSRLERLEPEARRVVRAASVFGEVFWRGSVAALLGGASEARHVDAWLKTLVEREVFAAIRESTFPGERELRFQHGLLRDAAYAMLTESDRAKGHALAAEWLEATGEKDALTLADHFERGGESSRAVRWLIHAAQAAGDGCSVEAAIKLSERGLACDPGDGDRGRLRLAQCTALAMRGDWPGVADAAREAMGLLPVGSVQWFYAAALAFSAGSFLGDASITAPLVSAIMGVSVQPEPSGPYAIAVHTVGVGLSFMGQFDLARSFIERAEALGKDVSDPDPVFALRLIIARGYVDYASGQIAKALAAQSKARTLADSIGDTWSRVAAPTFYAIALSSIGDCDRADAAAREVRLFPEATFWIDWSDFFCAAGRIWTRGTHDAVGAMASFRALLDRRDPMLAANVRAGIAQANAMTGDFDAAEAEATIVLQRAFIGTVRTLSLATLAIVALHRQQAAEALAFAERGLDAVPSGIRWLPAESVLHLARAEAFYALGRGHDAHAAMREARDYVLGVAATLDEPELRTSWLNNVDANARTLALAKEWIGE